MPRNRPQIEGLDPETTVPTVLDLFSGAGGLSLGFRLAGYRVLGALDCWDDACASIHANEPRSKVLCADVTTISEEAFCADLGERPDVVLGGPSCQGFSTSSGLSRNGRREDDPRNSLFMHFVRLVRKLQPPWVVMENVPGLLLYNKGQVARLIIAEFAAAGYSVVPIILLAADFGVPQLRRRLVFIGNRTGQRVSFPLPTHGDPALWKNFALPFAHLSRIGNKNVNADRAPHVSIGEAIGDLSPLAAGEQREPGPYPSPPLTAYQEFMRQGATELTLHCAGHLSRANLACVRILEEGQNWRDLPPALREHRFGKIRSYDATTVFRRSCWDRPSHTITTKCNDPTAGAFIHPREHRTFSLREAARLQSFPDAYRFVGSEGSIRRQIGNAVPPLLAKRIAEAIAPEVLECRGVRAPLSSFADRVSFERADQTEVMLGLRDSQDDPRQLELFDIASACDE